MASDKPRRSNRDTLPVTRFSFPPDHRTAATRIQESRNRERVYLAVRKSRGMTCDSIKEGPQVNVDRQEDVLKENVKQESKEDEEEVEQQEETQLSDGDQQDKDNRKKSPLIVKFRWNRNK